MKRKIIHEQTHWWKREPEARRDGENQSSPPGSKKESHETQRRPLDVHRAQCRKSKRTLNVSGHTGQQFQSFLASESFYSLRTYLEFQKRSGLYGLY